MPLAWGVACQTPARRQKVATYLTFDVHKCTQQTCTRLFVSEIYSLSNRPPADRESNTAGQPPSLGSSKLTPPSSAAISAGDTHFEHCGKWRCQAIQRINMHWRLDMLSVWCLTGFDSMVISFFQLRVGTSSVGALRERFYNVSTQRA